MANPLDICFVVDTTASMKTYLEQFKKVIEGAIKEIQNSKEFSMRFALVAYRDHYPQNQEYVTKTFSFNTSLDKILKFIKPSTVVKAGDRAEAVADALRAANNLVWREEAIKICILTTDAPPHGLPENYDNFPEGCPNNYDPMLLAREMADKGITLHVIGCERINKYKEWYSGLAHITCGYYAPLEKATELLQEEANFYTNIKRRIEEEFFRILNESEIAKKIIEDLKAERISGTTGFQKDFPRLTHKVQQLILGFKSGLQGLCAMEKRQDICFAIDSTFSMRRDICVVQEVVTQLLKELSKSSRFVTRVALVEYRDHPPQKQEFVTRPRQFTKMDEAQNYINSMEAADISIDGDDAEAVADALYEVLMLDWEKESSKTCVLITDSPPHGLITNDKDNYPKGCPEGHDPMKLAGKMSEKGIKLQVIGCGQAKTKYKQWYCDLADLTGGGFIPLKFAVDLPKDILVELLDQDICKRIEEEFFHNLKEKPICKHEILKQIQENLGIAGTSFAPSEKARAISKFETMRECKGKFAPFDQPLKLSEKKSVEDNKDKDEKPAAADSIPNYQVERAVTEILKRIEKVRLSLYPLPEVDSVDTEK